MPKSLPSYIRLHETGGLARRIVALRDNMEDCTLCPRYCHINRLAGEKGILQGGSPSDGVELWCPFRRGAPLSRAAWQRHHLHDLVQPPLDRSITADEYREALAIAREAGQWRLDGAV